MHEAKLCNAAAIVASALYSAPFLLSTLLLLSLLLLLLLLFGVVSFNSLSKSKHSLYNPSAFSHIRCVLASSAKLFSAAATCASFSPNPSFASFNARSKHFRANSISPAKNFSRPKSVYTRHCAVCLPFLLFPFVFVVVCSSSSPSMCTSTSSIFSLSSFVKEEGIFFCASLLPLPPSFSRHEACERRKYDGRRPGRRKPLLFLLLSLFVFVLLLRGCW
mmetsp:Transcript_2163/g.7745  ORF Transcript_2163/g.7745 Transcript_2163/m.7745 type:complete len:219 (+) Transcript_2163:377-1033(+)